MNKHFDIIKKIRQRFLNIVEDLPIEALNEIPAGFNNNILWNFGHIIAVQQSLCYKRANLSPGIEEQQIARYGKGSKPEQFITSTELGVLKQQLFTTIDGLADDLDKGIFTEYDGMVTGIGLALDSIEDAVKFIAVHDGMHLGYSMALRRLVVNK